MEKEQTLPSQSILLLPEKEIRKNFFDTQIFYKYINPENNKEKDKEENKLIKELEDILICCVCYEYLEEPMNDPTCCVHYACKKCLDKMFEKIKSTSVKCPLCRKLIRKKYLIKIPVVESIKEILKEAKNNKYGSFYEKIEEKCDIHPKNPIFYICLDCRKKMCPICGEEKKKHESHHLVNYERYKELFYFFRDNFANIKQTIEEKENNIKVYSNLSLLIEQQKNAYLNLFKNIYKKIEKIYNQNQEQLKKIIADSMQTIAKLRNFMLNVKTHVSDNFQNKYNDIENIEEIKEEIKKRINKLQLNKINKSVNLNIQKKYNKNIFYLKKGILVTLERDTLFKNPAVTCKVDEEGNMKFGAQLSEDKKMIIFFFDALKVIKNEPNESSYIAYIEYGKNKTKLYLEPYEIDKINYSFEKSLPIEEIFKNKENSVDLYFSVCYLTLQP